MLRLNDDRGVFLEAATIGGQGMPVGGYLESHLARESSSGGSVVKNKADIVANRPGERIPAAKNEVEMLAAG